ncbi:capsular polysaccharide export protein, LipB/KpsS family [Comamonas terrigena]|uniref:capsular polysaccharide export protein, LipB/KpsS family n=1 Tax=Comamonas terrigena TaxID=32013 RepID=UPI00289E6236|nr:glycosyltransferase [Comamonas terrigena]
MSKLLSIITPFYSSSEESYLNERITLFIEKSFYPEWMERIIVDFGSPEKISKRVSKLCEDNGYLYLNLKKGRERFSAGKCRNIGAQIAKGDYLSFSDVDLLTDETVYKEIYSKIKENNYFNFFEIIPCFYLTEIASNNYLSGALTHDQVYHAYLNNNLEIIKATAPATSCFLLRKDFYLSEGGMRDDFFGHGYEDFELLNRLAIKSNKFYRSHDYYSHSHKYDSLEYKGYRTFFSLFGRENLAKGNYYVHIYHEPAKDIGYKESSARNRKIFESCLVSFDKKKDSPPALDNISLKDNILMLGWKDSIPFKGLRELIPLLGKINYRHENEFRSIADFDDFLKKESIDYVFFLNPYGNEHRLEIFNFCKKENIKFIVYDRGALPNSWFFDTNGFNADSISYKEENWRRELDENQFFSAEKYINNLCSSNETLENNGERVGAYAFKKKYSCVNKKILFVPLQRPNDTVIRYFSGSVSGVDEFLSYVRRLAANLPADWVICIKQHPLENYDIEMPSGIVVDNNTHVHDLIEAADAVLLINSGVGLISLCFGKPVFCLGDSFYTASGLATRLTQEDDFSSYIINIEKYIPNEISVKQFIYYLTNNFYSFADTEYAKVPDGNEGAYRNMAVSLKFHSIRIHDLLYRDFERKEDILSTKAPAYDYYRAYFLGLNNKDFQETVSDNKDSSSIEKSDIQVELTTISNAGNSKNKTAAKKFKKLLRNPKAFFKDALKNVVK